MPPPQKKKSGKYFSRNYYVICGHFSAKYHVKLGHFVNFSLRSAAVSAADPALLAAASKHDVISGQTAITSHVNGFPRSSPTNQRHPIGEFAIGTGYSTWLLGD